MKFNQLRDQSVRIRHKITRFTWGGAWAAALSARQRRNLTLFFYDGLFSAASDKIILTYMTIYLLTLGVTRQQIGFLSSFSNLSNAILLLPAALLVERSGERKEITLKSALASRLMVVLMAILPFFLLGSSALVWIIFSLVIIREAANNFAFPGWIALTGDIVPLEGRGRYFGSRNFIMGLAGIVVALLIGEFITQVGEPLGYQLAYLLAALFGGVSIVYFSRIKDPHPPAKKALTETKEKDEEKATLRENILGIITSIKEHPQFINFAIYTAVWNFSIQIAAPFFTVFMVETLHLTAAMIGVVTVVSTTANMLVQRRVGLLTDKWGNRIVSIFFLFLIPIIPLVWGLWVQKYWHVIVLEVFTGLLWGGFNLVSFNNLLMQTPEDQRARFSAYYQIIVTLSMALGAGLGSLLIPMIEFVGVTLLSALGRFMAALVFLFFVKQATSSEQVVQE
jgi:MFS family permease